MQNNYLKILRFKDAKPPVLTITKMLENQFIYPNPMGSKLIFFAPLPTGRQALGSG
jgi:hypothetical protein